MCKQTCTFQVCLIWINSPVISAVAQSILPVLLILLDNCPALNI